MQCQDARGFIQGYLDGELTEAQAAPLRKHLLDCQPCRAGAQSEKNLRRWFVPSKAVPVPRDFAARVARRAFAGDRGERFSEPQPVFAASTAGAGALPAHAGRTEERSLRFVLALTAVAAALLLTISMAIRTMHLPSGMNLHADDRSTMSIDEARARLERLNQASGGVTDSAATKPAAAKPAAATPAETTPAAEGAHGAASTETIPAAHPAGERRP